MRLPIELQSLVDIYDQSFVVIDPNHLVVLVNKAFKDAYRVRGNEVVGRPCYAVIPPKDQPCPCAPKGERCPFAEVFQRAVSRVSTHTHRDAEGHDHFVRIQGFPLRTEGAGIYLGAVIQTDVVHHPDTDPEACPGVRMVGQSSTFKEFRQAADVGSQDGRARVAARRDRDRKGDGSGLRPPALGAL